MKKLILMAITMGAFSAVASTGSETNLASYTNPTDANIRKAVRTLSNALKTGDSEEKARQLHLARKLLNTRKIETTYAAAIYVDKVKQFEGGEDSAYNFDETCYLGNTKAAAELINAALEQGLWAGDEESVQSAAVNGKEIDLKVHDGPNDEDMDFTIKACVGRFSR